MKISDSPLAKIATPVSRNTSRAASSMVSSNAGSLPPKTPTVACTFDSVAGDRSSRSRRLLCATAFA